MLTYTKQELSECLETLNKVYNNKEILDNGNIKKMFLLFDNDLNGYRLDYSESMIKAYYYNNSRDYVDKLLYILVYNKQLELIKQHYTYFFINNKNIKEDILQLAIETNNVDIIKLVLFYGYENNSIGVLYRLAKFNDVEILDLYIKGQNGWFFLRDIEKMTKEIFIYCYTNKYHTMYSKHVPMGNKYKMYNMYGHNFHKYVSLDFNIEYVIRNNINIYIANSNYNEYVMEYLMLNEFIDFIDYNFVFDIDYSYRSRVNKLVFEIKHKYIEMLEDNGVTKDIALIVLEYLFYNKSIIV